MRLSTYIRKPDENSSITLLGKYQEDEYIVACSGGIDSMVLLDIFRKKLGKKVTVVHVNHATGFFCDEAEDFVRAYCSVNNIEFKAFKIPECTLNSKQQFWREHRYAILDTVSENTSPVLLGHQLNDAVETWIFTALHGNAKLIPSHRAQYSRPLILNSRTDLIKYAEDNRVSWFECPSNQDTKYKRNSIRHQLMPNALDVNPDLPAMIRKKLVKAYVTTVLKRKLHGT